MPSISLFSNPLLYKVVPFTEHFLGNLTLQHVRGASVSIPASQMGKLRSTETKYMAWASSKDGLTRNLSPSLCSQIQHSSHHLALVLDIASTFCHSARPPHRQDLVLPHFSGEEAGAQTGKGLCRRSPGRAKGQTQAG